MTSIKEYLHSAVTFSICNSLANKILALIFSLIQFGLYFMAFLLIRNSDKKIDKLETFYLIQISFQILLFLTSMFMLLLSKCLNRMFLYRIFRFITILIPMYLFFNLFFDICNFVSLKYLNFPNLYRVNEDPLFDYKDENLEKYSLEKYFTKNTNIIDISKINQDIFSYTYLEKYNDQIYVPDSQHFKINFTIDINNELKPYQKMHLFEFNFEMKIHLINIIFDISSYFLWKAIKYKHRKLIQKSIIKKYGRKIVYTGYGRQFLMFTISHDEEMEKEARKEIKNNDNYMTVASVDSCSFSLSALMELIAFYGSLLVFIVLIISRSIRNFTDNALYFPFVLTFLGDELYYTLIIFLIINFGIDILFIRCSDIFTNHHANIDNFGKQICGGIIIFTFGIIYLLISIFGIIGTLYMIVGSFDSNGDLYIKTACINSDISCYNLFQFASSFPLDNKKYSKIFYYIKIKSISKSEQTGDLIRLFAMLLIYFCQFYASLFGKIFMFNCSRDKFGLCAVNNYIKFNESTELWIDYLNVEIDDTEKFYLNKINDDYFKIPSNNKENNMREMEEN